MAQILYAEPIINIGLSNLNKKCLELTKVGITPHLVIILVGDDPASLIYVNNKINFAKKVGVQVSLCKLEGSTKENELSKIIELYNLDHKVDGIILQLPLPKHLNSQHFLNLINPKKDVDCLSPQNIQNFYYQYNENLLIPCTPKGIIKLLSFYNIPLAGKDITVIGRSNIVGKPLKLLLEHQKGTVTTCHSHTTNLKKYTLNSDIIISAIGKPLFFTQDYFRNDQSQVVIDVGMNKNANGKLVGDVDFENVKNFVSAITPVPGGVGRLTVMSLIENTILNASKRVNL